MIAQWVLRVFSSSKLKVKKSVPRNILNNFDDKFLILFEAFEMMKRKYQDDEKLSPVLRKIIWLFGTARNAVVVIVAALVAFVVDNKNIEFWENGCVPGSYFFVNL